MMNPYHNQPTPSEALFERSVHVMPGGVNSPVRAFDAVGGTPVFIERGHGARVVAEDGRELIDFCGSWGALIFGHAHAGVVQAVCKAAAKGTSFGACTRGETELAELIREQVPCIDMVRLVNSGTEAVMTALRLARACTGRDKILKFDGCYHGHGDQLLVAAGSGLLTHGVASSSGVSDAAATDTLVAPYNDLGAVERIVYEFGDDLAAIIVEPIACNMGLVKPACRFLEGLRKAADRSGAMLIFDEVITGFRLGPTTHGTLCNVIPDLTCLGKIIGGGLPIGAVGGTHNVMQRLAPVGDVYQAGTLSGNPVAVAAGLTTLRTLINENPYPRLAALGDRLRDGLNETRAQGGDRLWRCVGVGGMFTVFFTSAPVVDKTTAMQSDTDAYARFFHAMLDRGFYLPPSQFEVGFISIAHSEAEIAGFVENASAVLRQWGGDKKAAKGRRC